MDEPKTGPLPSGYRKLSDAELMLVNGIKDTERSLLKSLDAVSGAPGCDLRALAIARTEFQTGLMWLTRAITRPE